MAGLKHSGKSGRFAAAGHDQLSDEDFLKELGHRVRNARARLGVTRKMLAAASGVSERHLAQLETGGGNISILLLRQIAQATATRLEDLVADGTSDLETLSLLTVIRQGNDRERKRLLDALADMRDRSEGDARCARIALIGLRGAGKSTLGQMAAERLGLPFVELNREIEAESGLSIGEIFSIYGEQGYRRLEQRCLKLVIARHRTLLLAVAGGIVAEPETFEALLDAFHTIWLRASPEEHMARVRAQGDRRPMAGNPRAMDDLRAILEGRETLYARADARLLTSGKSVEQSCEELCRLIGDMHILGEHEDTQT